MANTKKLITMTVTVSVPKTMSAARARKHVRSLISYGAPWDYDGDDLKIRAVGPAPKDPYAKYR